MTMTTTSAPTVILPIETVVRELDSKFVTAVALASRGVRSIVAHKEVALWIAERSNRVVWLGKNLFSDKSSDHHADRLIANRSASVFMQDEGGIFQSNSWDHNVLQKHWVDEIRSRKIDRVLMWGQRQKQLFESRAPEATATVSVTGSPRFDLCTPDYAWMTAPASREIADRFGRYILVCTRFTAIAHAEGLGDPFRRKMNPRIWPKDYDSRKIADLWFLKWQRDARDFVEFVMLVKAMADAYPDRTIVLRPHPSEGIQFYELAFASFKNIVVIREGSVLTWIRSADLVLHSNCTTGIEAVIAGVPVVNFLPDGEDRGDADIEVAREAGTPAASLNGAMELIAALLVDRKPPCQTWSPAAVSVLNNLEQESVPLVVDEVMAVLDQQKLTQSDVVMPPKRPVRRMVKRIIGRTRLYNNAYIASKRPALEESHFQGILDGCRAKGSNGGRITDFDQRFVVIEP